MSEKRISELTGFRVQVTSSFEEAEPDWRALETTGDAIVFQTYDWQATWYRVVSRRKLIQPCIVIVRMMDDLPLMLLPLGIVRRGLCRALTWLGGELADYNGPVLAAGAAADLDGRSFEALWRQLCSELPTFDYVDFQRQPAEIGDQQNPLRQLSSQTDPISGCYTRLQPSWTSYHNAKRGAQTRRKERRKEGKLGEHGPIDFVIAQTATEIDRIVAAMVAQKSASYQRKGVRNLFRDQAYVDFIKAFTHAYAASGLVVLAAIEVQDEIVAAQWGLVRNKRFYCLVHAHDQGRFGRYSPGNILLRRLLEWSCENDIRIFDFTYGEESYKDHWCEGRLTLHESLLPQTSLGRVVVLGIRCRDGMRGIVKRFSHLYAFANTIRRLWYNALPVSQGPAKPRPGTERPGAA